MLTYVLFFWQYSYYHVFSFIIMAKVTFRKDVDFNIPEAAYEYAKKTADTKEDSEEN